MRLLLERENCWDMIYDFCSEIEKVFYEREHINQPVRERLSAMLEKYEETKNKDILWDGIAYIEAYLISGFDYKKNADIFEQFSKLLGYKPKEMWSTGDRYKRYMKKTRNSIRTGIKNWRPSPEFPMLSDDLVSDILEKMTTRKLGFYHYIGTERGTSYDLLINEEEIIFHCYGNHPAKPFHMVEE